jgi:serine/threonine-protein kinase RsbW
MRNSLTIKSDIESLHRVEKFIDEISAEYHVSDEVYGNILVATLEAANNAIVHGNKKDFKKNVEINFKVGEKKLELTVKDEGPGFNYKSIPDPTAPENIEKPTGRGIFLMEKLSDQIAFFENGRIVKLTFNLHC